MGPSVRYPQDRGTMQSKHIDDLVRRFLGALPAQAQAVKDDLEKNLRAALDAQLAKLDVVTRAEFDVQAAVLARTRTKLEQLEQQVAELERRHNADA